MWAYRYIYIYVCVYIYIYIDIFFLHTTREFGEFRDRSACKLNSTPHTTRNSACPLFDDIASGPSATSRHKPQYAPRCNHTDSQHGVDAWKLGRTRCENVQSNLKTSTSCCLLHPQLIREQMKHSDITLYFAILRRFFERHGDKLPFLGRGWQL